MARPNQFNEQQIIDAAFNLLAIKGSQAITARGVAHFLNASTAPIYLYFSSIDALYNKVITYAASILIQYTEKKYTSDLFLNIGVGLLEFSKAYPLVYRCLFLDKHAHKNIFKYFADQNLIQMNKEKTLRAFTLDQKKEILSKLTVYTHGLAALLCAEMLEDTTTTFFIHSLGEAGAAIIGYTAYRDNITEYFELYAPNHNPLQLL